MSDLILYCYFSLYFINLACKNATPTTVGEEIKSDKRKTYTEPVHADMMAARPLMAMQPPMRYIVGPFQPMGLPAAFRTMVCARID